MSEFLRRCKPPFAEQNITHYKQKYNWDCGLSCVLMILPEEERQYFLLNFEQICRAEEIDKSTWTIDLCYILKRFRILHSYFTKTFGVHTAYRGQAYYDRILHKDECRINTKFEFAASQGLKIERKSISADVLINHLEFHGPIILLIDANILVCDICKMNKLNMELRSCLPWTTQYIGHYIVVCAYDEYKRKFVYRNPSFKNRLCVISHDGLDAARKCFGTDEDTILIFNRKNNQYSNWGYLEKLVTLFPTPARKRNTLVHN